MNWHPANLDPGTATALHRVYGDEWNLPKTVFFGDDTRIRDADIHAIRAVLESEETVFAWRRGGVMLLDNRRIGHCRHRSRVSGGFSSQCRDGSRVGKPFRPGWVALPLTAARRRRSAALATVRRCRTGASCRWPAKSVKF